MTTIADPGRCTCTSKCRLRRAPGEPYSLAHDPRPEKQAERSALMSKRGTDGGKRNAERKQAARTASAETISIRTVVDQFAALDFVTKGVAGGTVSSGDAAVIVASVRAAQTLLRVEELETENRELRKLIRKHVPTLKKH